MDVAAKEFLTSQQVLPLPYRRSRHVSIRGNAKGSERTALLFCLNMNVAEHMVQSSTSVRRATIEDADALRHAKVSTATRHLIHAARHDAVRITGSKQYTSRTRRWPDLDVHSSLCTCGIAERQTLAHVLGKCQLASIAAERMSSLIPAIQGWTSAMDSLEPTSKLHAQSTDLERHISPLRSDTITSVDLDALLGIVQRPEDCFRLPQALRLMLPLLSSVARMLRLAAHDARPRIHRAFTQRRHRDSQQSAFRVWRILAVVRAQDWRPLGVRRRASGGLILTVRYVLSVAVDLVRTGRAQEGACMEQRAILLAARVRIAWLRWRETCVMREVFLASVLLGATPSTRQDIRQRPRGPECKRGEGGIPVALAHLHPPFSRRPRGGQASSVTEGAMASLHRQRLVSHRIVRAHRDTIRARLADALSFETLSSEFLVDDDAWSRHFGIVPGALRPDAPPSPATPVTMATRPARRVRAVTPQSALSVAQERDLTPAQRAMAGAVLHAPAVHPPGVLAHQVAAQSILARGTRLAPRPPPRAPRNSPYASPINRSAPPPRAALGRAFDAAAAPAASSSPAGLVPAARRSPRLRDTAHASRRSRSPRVPPDAALMPGHDRGQGAVRAPRASPRASRRLAGRPPETLYGTGDVQLPE